jgi:hypothetical protein
LFHRLRPAQRASLDRQKKWKSVYFLRLQETLSGQTFFLKVISMKTSHYFQASLLAALFISSIHAQTVANVSGGRLMLTTGNTSQNVKIEAVSGVVRVFGFAGIPDGTSYGAFSGLTLRTGAANDIVEIEVSSGQSYDVRVDTGAGNSETKLKWRILGGAALPAANFTRSGAQSGVQIVAIEVESESSRAAVAIDAGGATDVGAKVNSSNFSELLRVAFAASAAKVNFELGSAATSLEVDVRGGGTSGNDELVYKIAQSRAAQVQLNWALDALGGEDKVESVVSAPGSTVTTRGSVLGRAGNDSIQFETDAFATITGLTLNGGTGADRLSQVIKGRFQSSQTLRPVLLGGEGDDVLVLTTDTGIFGTGLDNDTFPLIDCGLGIDSFQAFGLIRGCESRL